MAHCAYFCHLSGSEEDLFFDAPSSPIGNQTFFPDNPMPLSYKRKVSDTPKNMTEFIMTFEISEVQRGLGHKYSL